MDKNVLSLFSRTDVEGISTLIAQMEKSPFDYLKLEGDGVKIVIAKNGVTDAAEVVVPNTTTISDAPIVSVAPIAATAPAAPVAVAPVTENPSADAAPVPSPSAIPEQPGTFVIKSPSYGMFYAQPDPSSPPYVTVGSLVKKGDTIGLLEIMKTFNAITSEVEGEVLAIHVKNEDLLEPGQALVSIKQS
jgi:acetyl-CoA carboxylase biotin carboxyl carrier protein